MDYGDLAEDDEGIEEYAITAITLYDRTACMLCSRVCFFYLIDYESEEDMITKWGNCRFLKDENVLTHAGFSLARLFEFVNPFAYEDGVLNAEKARQVVFAKCGPGNEDFRLFGILDGERVALDRLFATPVATPDPTPVPTPVVEIEVETTAVVSMDEEDTDEQQQHHHQSLAMSSASARSDPPFKPMVICPEIQRAIDVLQDQLQEKMRNLPPLPDSLFRNPTNQQNSAPILALRDVMAVADPQPCSSNSLPPNSRDCIRNAYKKITPELLERARAELNRPGTASSISSCGSSSSRSTPLSRAHRSDREKRKLEVIRHVKQKCDPSCKTCDQLLK
ncbi:hypothetical protein niasHT_029207 [Heterodera trifolii]|uniref:Uncharacterized protein n=1 Tax=Heterodera trifolii TaxID=157864 RepID=A0ABD2JZU8_9BILA